MKRRVLFQASTGFLLALVIILFFFWTPLLVFTEDQDIKESILILRPEQTSIYMAKSGLAGAKMLLCRKEIYLGFLTMKPGAKAPVHHHDKETEIIYCLKGTGTFIFEEKEYKIGPGMLAIIIPKSNHSFRVTSPFESFKAIQIWAPGGPEKKYLEWKAME